MKIQIKKKISIRIIISGRKKSHGAQQVPVGFVQHACHNKDQY